MFMVTVRLRWAPGALVASAHRVRTEIELAALPTERLEHVYVQLPPTRSPTLPPTEAGAVLFLVAPDLARAEATAAELVGRTIRAALAGWRIVSCQAELIVAFSEAALPPDE
jgi:hypothetical protein